MQRRPTRTNLNPHERYQEAQANQPCPNQNVANDSSGNVTSPVHKPLPLPTFRFMDLGEIKFLLLENKDDLYIIVYSKQSHPFLVTATYWPMLDDQEEPFFQFSTLTATSRFSYRSL